MSGSDRAAEERGSSSGSSPYAIGACVTALALTIVVIDHWLGDESGVDDPVAVLAGGAVSVLLATFLFLRVIPATQRHPQAAEEAAKRGLVCSILGLVTVPLVFLGFPVVLGGAGIALGLTGLAGTKRGMAIAAIVLGALPIVAGSIYAIQGGETPDGD